MARTLGFEGHIAWGRGDAMTAVLQYPGRSSIKSPAVSELTLLVSRKPQRKHRGREGDRGRGVIHLPLAGEVNPRVGLLVEAEDLHGG